MARNRVTRHLVHDWKNAWKWFSVQCMAGALALHEAWVYVPADLKSQVPEGLTASIVKWLLILGIIGRFLKQEKPHVVVNSTCSEQSPVTEMVSKPTKKKRKK